MRTAIPLPITYLLIGLSILLNFASMASLVDGFIIWIGFFKDFVDLYEKLVREPVHAFVIQVLPLSWPRPPLWLYDVIVIWGACFLGFRMSVLFDRTQTPFSGPTDFFITPIAGPLTILTFAGLFLFSQSTARRSIEQRLLRAPTSIGPEYARFVQRKRMGLSTSGINRDKILEEFRSTKRSNKFGELVEEEKQRIRTFTARTLCYLILPYVLIVGAIFINFLIKRVL